MRLAWRSLRLALVAALGASTMGCVESYQGSWVEFTLAPGTQLPADVGNVGNGQPPANTHFEFWVKTGDNAFKVAQFLVAKQFDSEFPCFIDINRARFPGLHSTRFYDRLLEDVLKTGDPNVPDQDETNLLADALKRLENMELVEARLKAVVGYDPEVTPEVIAALEDEIAAAGATPDKIDDESNARRLEICNAFFDAHPRFYVGGDKVFSLPLSGDWYGMVEGTDPRNNAPVGGAGFTVPFTFKNFDYIWMTWQFNQATYLPDGRLDETQPFDPRIKTATGGLGPFGPSATGYHYMSGTPRVATRRTINVDLRNVAFGALNGQMAIFPAVNEDDAVF